jgi:stage II sporulation protein D
MTRAPFLLLLALPLSATTLKIRVGARTIEMPAEKYVAAVLAGETSVFQSDEALKAMSVAARSYGLHFRGRHAAEGFDLCSTTHCQRVEPDLVTPRIEKLVAQTEGEVLWYEGRAIFACYSRNCGGTTEDAGAVWTDLATPYLRSHPDPYCTRNGVASWEWSGDARAIAAAIEKAGLHAPADLNSITIAARTRSGRARILMLAGPTGKVPIAAGSFRFALGRILGWNTVRSDRFDVASSSTRLTFHGAGEGHGAGLCQRGADQMGREGASYREILAFYYPGTSLGVNARGISWSRMTGETVTLESAQIERDRSVLAIAERIVQEITHTTGWPAPAPIELRVYPDITTYRDATGEPGWVAAHTVGRRIELQPASKREVTIRHELLHVFVESQARPGLPVWFREGLVGYLAHEKSTAAETTDADVRQRTDESRARQANAAAVQRVADLVRRNGESTVLGWLKSGIPQQ